MSIDLKHPDYIDLRNRIRENPREFVALVGAGLSKPCGLPSWGGLRDALVADANARVSEQPEPERAGYKAKLKRLANADDLWYCFSELQGLMTVQAYQSVIRQKLTVRDRETIPKTYDLLWKLNIRGLVTYNIDTCATDSYSRVKKLAADAATGKDVYRFAQFLTGISQFVFQPHGHINDPSSWVFTRSELDDLLLRKAYGNFMRSLCQSKHLLILGLIHPTSPFYTYFRKLLLFPTLPEQSTTYFCQIRIIRRSSC